MPNNIPGMIPAIKSLPIETPAILPYSTKAMLGGIIGPIVEATA